MCKILTTELEDRLETTGKSHDVLEIGYSVDDVKPKKKTQYKKSWVDIPLYNFYKIMIRSSFVSSIGDIIMPPD